VSGPQHKLVRAGGLDPLTSPWTVTLGNAEIDLRWFTNSSTMSLLSGSRPPAALSKAYRTQRGDTDQVAKPSTSTSSSPH